LAEYHEKGKYFRKKITVKDMSVVALTEAQKKLIESELKKKIKDTKEFPKVYTLQEWIKEGEPATMLMYVSMVRSDSDRLEALAGETIAVTHWALDKYTGKPSYPVTQVFEVPETLRLSKHKDQDIFRMSIDAIGRIDGEGKLIKHEAGKNKRTFYVENFDMSSIRVLRKGKWYIPDIELADNPDFNFAAYKGFEKLMNSGSAQFVGSHSVLKRLTGKDIPEKKPVEEEKLSRLKEVLEAAGMAGFKAGLLVTRMGDIDGVSLETEKVVHGLQSGSVDVNAYIGKGYVKTPGVNTQVNPVVALDEELNVHILSMFFRDFSGIKKLKKALEYFMNSGLIENKRLKDEVLDALRRLDEDTDGDDLRYTQENKDVLRYIRPILTRVSRVVIEKRSKEIEKDLEAWIDKTGVKVVVPENCNTIPAQIPFGMAIAELAARRKDIKFVVHNHDFWFERYMYQQTNWLNDSVEAYLDFAFPMLGENVYHMFINSVARDQMIKRMRDMQYKLLYMSLQRNSKKKELAARSKLLEEEIKRVQKGDNILFNVMDFSKKTPELDEYNSDFRERIGVKEDDFLIGNVVRIVERKGLEISVKQLEYLRNLKDMNPEIAGRIKIVITGGDKNLPPEENAYLHELVAYAESLGLEIGKDVIILDYFNKKGINKKGIDRGLKLGLERKNKDKDSDKVYLIEDVYANLDMVSYPSTYEGFGNALIEAIWAMLPVIVFPYSIYTADIRNILEGNVFEYPEMDYKLLKKFDIDVNQLKSDDLRMVLELSSVDASKSSDLRMVLELAGADAERTEELRKAYNVRHHKNMGKREFGKLKNYSKKYLKEFINSMKQLNDSVIKPMIKLPRKERIEKIRDMKMVKTAYEKAKAAFSYESMDKTLASVFDRVIKDIKEEKKLALKPAVFSIKALVKRIRNRIPADELRLFFRDYRDEIAALYNIVGEKINEIEGTRSEKSINAFELELNVLEKLANEIEDRFKIMDGGVAVHMKINMINHARARIAEISKTIKKEEPVAA
ncbi:hypothetical protein ACFLUV_07330, partial [Elusimicrobiota bacterium]